MQSNIELYFTKGCSKQVFPLAKDGEEFDSLQREAERQQTGVSSEVSQEDGNDVSTKGRRTRGGRLDYVGAIMTEKNKKWLENGKELSRNFPQGQRVYSAEGIATNICGNAGGIGAKTGLYACLTPDRLEKRQNGRRFKENGEPMFTLTGQDIHGISDGMKIRRLTPTECERLQSFPDGFTRGISDSQRYKCLGNAVTTNVIQAIGKKLSVSS